MREWRRLPKGIRESSALRRVSDRGRWLYVLLLSAQDDEGRYPWDDAMVATLIAGTTTWTRRTTDTLRDELAGVGLLTVAADHVSLSDLGRATGRPRSDVTPMLYLLASDQPANPPNRISAVIPTDTSRIHPVAATYPLESESESESESDTPLRPPAEQGGNGRVHRRSRRLTLDDLGPADYRRPHVCGPMCRRVCIVAAAATESGQPAATGRDDPQADVPAMAEAATP